MYRYQVAAVRGEEIVAQSEISEPVSSNQQWFNTSRANVLIGVIAFLVALYWTVKIERTPGTTVSKMEIWYRFPKFVLGFIAGPITKI